MSEIIHVNLLEESVGMRSMTNINEFLLVSHTPDRLGTLVGGINYKRWQ